MCPEKSSSLKTILLPDLLRSLFWDYDYDALEWEKDRHLIVRRILQNGNWPAVCWLRATLGDEAVRDWLLKHTGGRLSPRKLRYWEVAVDLPGPDVNKWINLTKESPWERRLSKRYPLLSPVVPWPERGVNLASLDDLACMKLSAIAQRGAKKDFYDVYALCSQHQPLEHLLELYQKKFSVTDIGPVLYGLVYFDDADEEPDPVLLRPIQWSQIKKAFRNWVKVIK